MTDSRPRPPRQPQREVFGEEDREDYDWVVERYAGLGLARGPGDAGPYFGALLHSPQLARGVTRLGQLVRTQAARGAYGDAEREFIDIVLCVDHGSNAIAAMHLGDALACGVRLEAVRALRDGDEDALLPEERQLAAFARAVVAGTVDDAMFAGISSRFGEHGAVELSVFIAFLLMTTRLWAALAIPGPDDDELDRMLQGYADGTIALPSADLRIG